MQAFIDLGTNSFKLQFAASPEDFGEGLALTRTVKLGEGPGGHLIEEAKERAREALEVFNEEIKRREVDRVNFFATAAVREADNGRDFLEEIESRFGWEGEILTGEQEAGYGFQGAGYSQEGPMTLIDLGGGSTELTMGEGHIEFSHSYPIGALKQSQSPQDLTKIFTDLPGRRGELVAIGGSARTFASIHEGINEYTREALHGVSMSLQWMQELAERVKDMSIEEKRELCAMDPKRAEILEGGLQVLTYLMKTYDADKLIYSDYGMIEGYALKHWKTK